MSFKTTYVLFGILLVIVAVFGLALFFDPLPVDLDDFVFPSAQDKRNPIDADKVVRVVIERQRPSRETITLERDGQYNRWRLKGANPVEADRVLVKHMIEDILTAKRSEKVRLGAPDKYGLASPAATVTLDLVDGKALTLKLGDSGGGAKDAWIYVQSSDRPDVLAVRKDSLEKLTKPEVYFRERDVLASEPSHVQSIELTHTVDGKPKEKTIELVREKGQWAYQQPFKGAADNLGTLATVEAGKPPSNVAALLDQITKLRVDYTEGKQNDFVADGVTDWSKYGLQSGGDLLTIKVTRTEERNPTLPKEGEAGTTASTLSSPQTVVIAVGKKADDKTPKYYARRDGENVAVMLPAAPVNALLELVKKPDAVRDRHLLTLDSEQRVPDAFTIKQGDSTLEFFRRDRDHPWQLYRGTATTPSNTREDVVKGLLALLSQGGMIEGFPEESPTREAELGLDKPTLVASFWVNGIAKEAEPEKKDGEPAKKPDLNAKPTLKNPDKPTARLTFGKRNFEKKTVYVKRELADEPPAVFEIKDVLFERLGAGPLAFLDLHLPGFRPGTLDAVSTVTRVQFTHDGKPTEVARTKDSDPWKFVLPKDLEGRTADANAVSALLGGLNRMTATRYVVEKATPTQLTNDYNLNPPAEKIAVTLTKDGKPVVYEFHFGKDAGAGDVFAKLGGAFNDETIFAFPRTTLNNLVQGQLLDKTVFAFHPGKVKEVLLRGWSESAGFVLTLHLVRKEGTTWEVKEGPPKEVFVLDSTRVNNFLNGLSNLRADRFVSHGGLPTSNQKLDVKLGGLSIQLTLEGQEKPLTLMLGAAEGASYFATSSTLPGDVILVNKSLFEGPRGSIAYFKK